jgi:hypothetical protein
LTIDDYWFLILDVSLCKIKIQQLSIVSRQSEPALGSSQRRLMPSGLASWSSAGRAASGKFCQATGRQKRKMASGPTELLRPSAVAG